MTNSPTGTAGEPIVTVKTDRVATSPERFLRAFAGGPRGLWSHSGRWTAFAGEAAVAESPARGDRFETILDAAAGILDRCDAANAALYGGFAFDVAMRPDPMWNHFPAARFVLPAVEITGTGDSGQATSRAGDRTTAEQLLLQASSSDPCGAAGTLGGVAREKETEREAWMAAVRSALAAIEAGEVDKVVLARTLQVTLAESDPVEVVERVRRENPHATVFYFEPQPGSAFIGAAPETVVTRAGDRFATTAVAGSTGRGRDATEDEALARELLTSDKERREHSIGVEDMVRRVAPFANDIDIDSEPHVLRLARIQHLETHISATVGPEHHILDLLRALHPTAAVSGFPRTAATELLHRTEQFDRGWYAGPVGWFDRDGNGVFAPGLRSAVGQGDEWRLFAGAGIVSGSDPEREWDETRIKFAPMLRALGTHEET